MNADTTADEIDFSVAGVIQLASALPAITNTVNIKGTSAPEFASSPLVEIDNNGFAGLTLGLNARGSNLASLSVVHANGPGVTLDADSVTVAGNYIGLALDGAIAANTGVGLFVDNSKGDTIGGTNAVARNVISGNGAEGIQLGVDSLGQSATVEGNFIGTDPTGLAAAANQGNGITIFSNGNIIGGTVSGAGNTIAFNKQSGVFENDGIGNRILSNSIFNNGSQGIEFKISEPLLSAPQLSYALESAGSTAGTVEVQVGGIVNVLDDFTGKQTFTVQVFANLAGVSAGQGQLFLGSVQATSIHGAAPFTLRNLSVPAGAGTTFTATSTGGEGTSMFSNSVGLSTPNQAYVANVYQLLLGRVPDPTASTWVNALNNGVAPTTVVLAIEGSPEYLSDQVNIMYELYLRRQADVGGTQFWVSYLLAGGTLGASRCLAPQFGGVLFLARQHQSIFHRRIPGHPIRPLCRSSESHRQRCRGRGLGDRARQRCTAVRRLTDLPDLPRIPNRSGPGRLYDVPVAAGRSRWPREFCQRTECRGDRPGSAGRHLRFTGGISALGLIPSSTNRSAAV